MSGFLFFFKILDFIGLLSLVMIGLYLIGKNGLKMLIPFYCLKFLTKKDWALVLIATLILFIGGLGQYLLEFYVK